MHDFVRNIKKAAACDDVGWGNENCFPPLCKIFNMRFIVLTDWTRTVVCYGDNIGRTMILGCNRSIHFNGFMKRTDTTLSFILHHALININIYNKVPEIDPNNIELEANKAKFKNETRN